MQFNFTQDIGMAGYAGASLATLLAAAKTGRDRPILLGVAVFYAVRVADIATDGRHVLATVIRNILRSHHEYDARRGPQMFAVAAITMIAMTTARLAWHRLPGGRRGILSFAGASLTIFLLEAVSFHYLDMVMYYRVGPVLLIGWVWLACSAGAAIAALSAITFVRQTRAAGGDFSRKTIS